MQQPSLMSNFACRDHLGYYEALGLEPGVTTPDIKNAFRQAALIWHPDRQKVCNIYSPHICGCTTAVVGQYSIVTVELSSWSPALRPAVLQVQHRVFGLVDRTIDTQNICKQVFWPCRTVKNRGQVLKGGSEN